MSVEENKAVIRRYFEEMWNQKRLELMDELTARDMIDHAQEMPVARETDPQPPVADPIELMKQSAQILMSAFPDLSFSVDDLIAEGDRVAARVTFRGTHKGPLMGLQPTGRRVDYQHVHIFRVVDGKAREHWSVRDDLRQLRQLGVMPDRPPAR